MEIASMRVAGVETVVKYNLLYSGNGILVPLCGGRWAGHFSQNHGRVWLQWCDMTVWVVCFCTIQVQ